VKGERKMGRWGSGAESVDRDVVVVERGKLVWRPLAQVLVVVVVEGWPVEPRHE
jgi:hypothetical protein